MDKNKISVLALIVLAFVVLALFTYSSAKGGANGGANSGGLFSLKGPCRDTCSSLGYNCGTQIICKKSVNCGTCQLGYTCSSGKCVCTPNCAGKTCGDNGCGGSCGNCSSGYVCTAGTCVASCTPESNTAFCTRLSKTCGSVTANDNCGVLRTVYCGNCTSGYTCTNGNCVISNSCNDTDGGDYPKVQGTVSGYSNNQPYSYADFCKNNLTLFEYYCSGTRAYNYTWSCTMNYTSCYNGACI